MEEKAAVDDLALMHLERAAEAAVSIYCGSKELGKIAETFGRRATGNRAVGEFPNSPTLAGSRRPTSERRPKDDDGTRTGISSATELPFAAYICPSNPTR